MTLSAKLERARRQRSTAMFEGLLQPTHLVLILVIALVVFGPSKLPELGASLGKSIREFKRSTQDISEIKE